MGLTVIVAEYVFVTLPDPPGANAASTVWNGTENWDVKIPFHVLRPSLVMPLATNCTED